MIDLAANLARVREAIAEAALRAGRRPEDVTLVGAGKTMAAELVAQAVSAGLTHVGENFVQEAQDKIPRVRALTRSPVTWHMIGHLQTNKVKVAQSCFDIIETVDSVRLAEALNRRSTEKRTTILLEVYMGHEAERPGLRPEPLLEQFGEIAQLPNIDVRGLMTVAPLGLDADETQAVFRKVRELRDRVQDRFPAHELPVLSMGMTDDFPLAIAEGATAVRVGRAIFGARPS